MEVLHSVLYSPRRSTNSFFSNFERGQVQQTQEQSQELLLLEWLNQMDHGNFLRAIYVRSAQFVIY